MAEEFSVIETKFEYDVKKDLAEIKQNIEELKIKINNSNPNPPMIG